MSIKERLPVSPMKDEQSKIAFHRPEFLKFFSKTFLNLDIETVADFRYTNGELFYVQERHEDGRVKSLKMIIDISVKLKNGKEIIIEIQVSKQDFFFWRLLLYMSGIIIEQFRNMDVDTKVQDRYPLMKPVYGVAIVKGRYFDDDIPFRTFGLKGLENNQPLLVLDKESDSHEQMIQMTIIEIDKYSPDNMTEDEKSLYEFFLNKPYSSGNIPSILTATDDFLYETKDWTEEDIMDWIKEQEIRAEERAEAKAQLLEVARKVVKEFGLNPEAVAQQFGISSETL